MALTGIAPSGANLASGAWALTLNWARRPAWVTATLAGVEREFGGHVDLDESMSISTDTRYAITGSALSDYMIEGTVRVTAAA